MHAIICILEFMNFLLFLIKFIKVKQRIKFKKFELHNYDTNYEDMKSSAKWRNWGSLGRLGVTQGHWQCHHSIERMRLPIRL